MILVTGSNGFVGQRLCAALSARGIAHLGAVRRQPGPGAVAVGEIGPDTDWSSALGGCTAVVHLAARVHVMNDTAADPLREHRRVNVEGTMRLARQAAQAGVRRFVFVSTVKVNGEATGPQAFRATDVPDPKDPYGQSKLEAEQALSAFARDSGLEVVIVRPPLVYGPGVKANFLNLIKLVGLGLPLPFGRPCGYRSMVAVDNLADLLITCCSHPRAPGQVFMVSDGKDLAVGELATMIARSMGKRVLLLPVPPGLMRLCASMVGKAAVADRLFGALCVDMTATQERLGWVPVVSQQAAIDETVAHFLKTKGTKRE